MRMPRCQDIPEEFWYPSNANEQDLQVFRLTIHSNSICGEDFLSKYELDKKQGKDTTRYANDDKYYGLSVLEDFADAQKLLAKVKAKRNNLKGVSIGSTNDGLIRKTPSIDLPSHHTWWPFSDANPEMSFSIYLNGDDHE